MLARDTEQEVLRVWLEITVQTVVVVELEALELPTAVQAVLGQNLTRLMAQAVVVAPNKELGQRMDSVDFTVVAVVADAVRLVLKEL